MDGETLYWIAPEVTYVSKNKMQEKYSHRLRDYSADKRDLNHL